MSNNGKLEQKLLAQSLRMKGMSLRRILLKVPVSKSTLSLWTRDIVLSDNQIKKLYQNQKSGSLKGSFIASQKKIAIRKSTIQRLLEEGAAEVGALNKRDRFIAGVSLYFGEGDKTDKCVGFTNGDPSAIKFMTEWLIEFCSVPQSKFRAHLFIHDTIDETTAKQFWSDLTSIPLNQFLKTNIKINNPYRHRKSILQYGVLRIIVNDIALHRKIMGWISGIFKL